MPVRKTNRGVGGLTGYVTKGHRNARGTDDEAIFFESKLERDYYERLKFRQLITGEVDRFEEQPLTLEYQDASGRTRRYTPDVLVVFTDPTRRPELVEIKYRAKLRKILPEMAPAYRAARALCAERGWRFRVQTEYSIRTPALKHARFFPKFLDRQHDPRLLSLVLDAIHPLESITVGGLLAQLACDPAPRAELLSVIWTLVARQFLLIEDQTPPTVASVIRPAVV